MWLTNEDFTQVVKNAPLVSIDLIVEHNGKYLVGLRNNRPAQGFYFVPGGRVLKNEKLDDAFERICEKELGIKITRKDSIFLGVYEHFYNDSMFDESISTHYIVLAYKIILPSINVIKSDNQHKQLLWLSSSEI